MSSCFAARDASPATKTAPPPYPGCVDAVGRLLGVARYTSAATAPSIMNVTTGFDARIDRQ